MTEWLVVTAILLGIIYHVRQDLLLVDIHKLSLITLLGWAAYWLDRSFFPYARPDAFMCKPHSLGSPYVPGRAVAPDQQLPFAAAMLRRAIIIGSVIIAGSLGL
jgi:hypothetical protein